VVIKDVLPAGYTYVSNDGGASYDGPSKTVTWTAGTVGTLTPKVLHITATLVGGLNPATGAYNNYAQVWASDNFDPDSTPKNNSTTEDDNATAALPRADLSVSKAIALSLLPLGDLDNSGSITLGDIVAFVLTVTNAGPDTATNVVVTDQLPAGYTYHSDSAGGAYDINTGVWSVGTVAAGTSSSISIRATVVAQANLTNAAEVTASGTYDPDSTPNNHVTTEDDYFSVTPTIGQAADLALDKVITQIVDVDSSGGLNAGDRVVFTLTLTNDTGPDDATGVVVKDQLPAGYTWYSDSGAGSYVPATGLWTVGTVAVGSTHTLTITGTVVGNLDPTTGAYNNYAQVWASNVWDPDSTPGDNSTDQDDDASVALPIADLQITKTDSRTTAVPGQSVTYTIVVTNAGPSTAAGAHVTDVFPATLTNVSFTSIATGGATGNTNPGGTVTQINDTVTMPAGSAIIYTVTGTVSATATGGGARGFRCCTFADFDPEIEGMVSPRMREF